mmetsp:Transcript_42806/g.106927  ORF Transcript_42806/g.106927 Transcript_42806/m.106927 type:complete len:513 (+) Transcript_42806:1892-3430(+)
MSRDDSKASRGARDATSGAAMIDKDDRRPSELTEQETETESETEMTEGESERSRRRNRSSSLRSGGMSSSMNPPSGLSSSAFPPPSHTPSTPRGGSSSYLMRHDRHGRGPMPQLEADKPWQQKMRTFRTRTIWTLILVSSFFCLLAAGHIYCTLFLLVATGGIYGEVIAIKRNVEKDKKMPLFFFLRWYFFACTIFFVGAKWVSPLIETFSLKYIAVDVILSYHPFISFVAFTTGFIAFVLTLRKFTLRYQFKQLAMVLITLLVVVVNSLSMIANVYNGLIWFVLPATLVVVNDVFAYIFGVFFGRTRLIALSPKKTWEGFIGASIVTMVWAVLCASVLEQYKWFICPQEKITFVPFRWDLHCDPNIVFTPRPYRLPARLADMAGLSELVITPMLGHAIVLGFFAAIIAPFGGFFASGVKRAFKIKDFGGSIPGHGGLTDRFDCQILMGIFTYIYYNSFVYTDRQEAVESILSSIATLSLQDQLKIYRRLHDNLVRRHALGSARAMPYAAEM